MAPKKILVIEDEQPLREAFILLLEHEGYEVAAAENGKVGINQLDTFKPDIILLDLLMPTMNGLEFLKATKAKRRRKPPYKTLVLTNLSDPMSREDIKTYNIDLVAMKADLSPTELATTVRNLLASD